MGILPLHSHQDILLEADPVPDPLLLILCRMLSPVSEADVISRDSRWTGALRNVQRCLCLLGRTVVVNIQSYSTLNVTSVEEHFGLSKE
jgi:hypothetical protein